MKSVPSHCIMRKVSWSAFYRTMILYLCVFLSLSKSVFHASGFFALPSTNFILAFPDDQFSDQSQAVRLGYRWGPLTGLGAEALAGSHLPRPPRCLWRYLLWEGLGHSTLLAQSCRPVSSLGPRSVLWPACQIQSLIYLALHRRGHCSLYRRSGCHSDSNAFRGLSGRHSHTHMQRFMFIDIHPNVCISEKNALVSVFGKQLSRLIHPRCKCSPALPTTV